MKEPGSPGTGPSLRRNVKIEHLSQRLARRFHGYSTEKTKNEMKAS
jgi:hypothetical protein